MKKLIGVIAVLFYLSLFCLPVHAQLPSSGPITVSGQTGVVIQGLHITNPSGDCVTITNSTSITIKESEIGPCSGNGIVVNGGSTINIFDNYIHPEGTLQGCCDYTDGIYAPGTTTGLTIQGNVIAYGESNIEAQYQTHLTVTGNFFLNPRNDVTTSGNGDRGQNVQVYYGSTNVTVEHNYTLSSTNTTLYAFAENQEDSINFGGSSSSSINGIIAQNNYITGGHSASGCGIIADESANSAQFLSNMLLDTGQCGIAIANGTNQTIENNQILNTTPVNGGGNTAIYVWNQYSPACGPVLIENNTASALNYPASSDGYNSYWTNGGCGSITLVNNTFDAAATALLTPASSKLPPPPIPPQPYACVAVSPFTNNTSLPSCGGASALSVTTASLPNGQVDVAYPSTTLAASGGTAPYSWSVTGLASGLSFAAGVITGTPTTAGTHSEVFTITDSSSPVETANATFSVTISAVAPPSPVSITTVSVPNSRADVEYASTTLKATGGTSPYSWSVTGLAPGLSLSTAGVITGTPTTAGTYSEVFTVSDSSSPAETAQATFSVTIASATEKHHHR